MIQVLNFKKYDRGAMRGFFDLRYHGLTIKGCRLMTGSNGLWFSFPQVKGDQDGETKYFDQMFVSPPERDHLTRLVVLELQQQGHIEQPKQPPIPKRAPAEDLSEHYTDGSQDSIQF